MTQIAASSLLASVAALALAFWTGSACGAEPGGGPVPEIGSWSPTWTDVSKWEHAYVTGNGRMGVMVYGGPAAETLVGNHCRLFLPKGNPEKVPDLAPTLPELRKIYREQGPSAGIEFWMDKAQPSGYRKIIPTDPVHPGFFLSIDTPLSDEAREYVRAVDFATGEVTVGFTDDDGAWLRRTFVSRTDNLIVTSITRPGVKRPIGLSIRAEIEHELIRSAKIVEDGWIGYHNTYTKGKGGYDYGVRVVARGGSTKAADGAIEVRGAREVLILAKIVPWKSPMAPATCDAWDYSPKNPDFAPENLNRYDPAPHFAASSVVAYGKDSDASALLPQVRASLEKISSDCAALFAAHAKVHGELFNRVSVDFGGSEADRRKSGEDLLAMAKKDSRLPMALLERMYNAGRFMFICCAGERPPNLQGIWTGSWSARWSGDFTTDTNEQLAVLVGLGGNLPELMSGHFSLVEDAIPDLRRNAKNYYGCRGIMMPPRMSNHGLMLHWGTWPGVYWTGGAGWMTHFFYDYYLHTGDREFLAKRVAPLVRETCLFLRDFVVEDPKTGKWQFIPSYSPEVKPGIDATMDVMVTRQMVEAHIDICRTLKRDLDEIPRWEAFLAELPDYRINGDGALAEFLDETISPEKQYSHRHLSHLYGPCYDPLSDVTEDKPKLWAAAREATRRRIHSKGQQSSHGRMHMGLAATYLRMPEDAWDRVLAMATSPSMYSSMIASHDPGPRTLNCDSNGSLGEVIHRMLFQSVPGRIDLLPALPRSLPKGDIRGPLARGQIHVDRLAWDAESKTVILGLTSGKTQTITLRMPTATSLSGDGVESADAPNAVALNLSAGKPVAVNLTWK